MKNIVVLGGGSAGWLTALYAKNVLPDANITVIESEEIGILGAGEGTTPHFIALMDFLQIPLSDLIKETNATVKNGIKFTNWTGDGSFYYHAFQTKNNLGPEGILVHEKSLSSYSAFISNCIDSDSLNDMDFVAKVSEMNKVLFNQNALNNSMIQNPIYNYNQLSNFAAHFDASKLAILLKDIGIYRGINLLEGVVDEIKQNDNGDIVNISLKNKKHTDVDFLFDCSGFNRVVIGKKLNSKWHSHEEKLPVDSAVPFFIPQDESVPAYTESIAMKYGWMWKIPLQNRYGCGYVFDSSLITEEEATKEIEKYLGFEPQYPRKNKGGFKFKAGYYETPWTNNCIAIGLSAGFIEPLEATSIWVSIMALENILTNVEDLGSNDQRIRDEFNEKLKSINEQVVDFIYFHYMSGRSDTKFWEKFTLDNATDDLKKILKTWEYRLPRFSDSVGKIWGIQSWMAVGRGINMLNESLMVKSHFESPAQQYGYSLYQALKEKQNRVALSCIDHKQFLEDLKK